MSVTHRLGAPVGRPQPPLPIYNAVKPALGLSVVFLLLLRPYNQARYGVDALILPPVCGSTARMGLDTA